MVPIDPRLPKMVYSSFLTTLKERLSTTLPFAPKPLKIFIEGDDRTGYNECSELIEVRLAGPDFLNPSDDNVTITVMVNFEIRVAKNHPNKFRVHELGGYCLTALTPISIVDGDNPDVETAPPVFCLDPTADPHRPIKYHSFGLVENALDVLQAGVFATFEKSVSMREIAASFNP